MIRPAGLTLAVMLAASGAAAQDVPQAAATATATATEANSWFLRAGYSPSRLLTASPLTSGTDEARTLTLEVGRQTDGTRDWHRVYNYPSYGVGVQVGRFGHERELGRPVAAYGFFSWPFPVSHRTQIAADFGLGVSWNWTAFDRYTNPTNTALGSPVAYYVEGGVSLRVIATERASMYLGLDATHWSNGSTSQPNLGLAVIGPKLGVRYNFAPQPTRSRAMAADLPRFEPSWEFVVGVAGSGKTTAAATNSSQLEVADRWREFGALNITAGVQRHFYRFGKVAAGADVSYDGATGARVDVRDRQQVESRAPAVERLSLGAYGGYEHVIGRFSPIVHLGYTAWRGFDDEEVPRFYQRYGSRFYFSDRFWGTFAVRSLKFRKANFVEFGFGYRVRWIPHAKLAASSMLPDPLYVATCG